MAIGTNLDAAVARIAILIQAAEIVSAMDSATLVALEIAECVIDAVAVKAFVASNHSGS